MANDALEIIFWQQTDLAMITRLLPQKKKTL